MTPPISHVALLAPAAAPVTRAAAPIPVAGQASGTASWAGMMSRISLLSAPRPAPSSLQVPLEPAPVVPSSFHAPLVSAGFRVVGSPLPMATGGGLLARPPTSIGARLPFPTFAPPATSNGSTIPSSPPPVMPSAFLGTPAAAAPPGGSGAALPDAAQAPYYGYGGGAQQLGPGDVYPGSGDAAYLQAAGGMTPAAPAAWSIGKIALYGGAAVGGLWVLSRLFGGRRE